MTKLLKLSLVVLPAVLLAVSGCNSSSALSPTSVLDTSPPAAPSGLVVTLDASGNRVLDWSPNSEPDLASYEVYQSTTGSGNGYALVGTLPAGSTSWKLPDTSGLVPAWFKVSAVDRTGNQSPTSSVLSVTLLPHTIGDQGPGDWTNPRLP